MTQFTPAMDAALAAPVVTTFGAVQIDLPGYTLRLLTGPIALAAPWDGFVGRDPTYGVLAGIDDLRDGGGEQAPALTLQLHPASDAAAATLAAPEMQGSKVQIWLGVVNPATGIVIPDPLLIFIGELDVPRLIHEEHSRILEYDLVSAFDRFFAEAEGIRLADSFHQSIWPGETGFAHVTGITEQVYWGETPPNPSVKTVPGGYGGYPGIIGIPFL